MEAVPRLPMISFPGRTSIKPTEFGEHLKRYIRDHYHEDPESYNNEVIELESLRRSAVNASTDFIGCSTLKKYYCQLHYLTSRFQFDETGIKLSFSWCSAFDQNYSESGDINYEMSSILYNIATLHTALGALDARTTSDGMKISCTHFQCASWAFQVLSQSSRTDAEINALLMTFMMNLSLSQAQECILEKSMTDNRKPNIIAKVAMQVVEYLRLTLKNIESFKKSNTNAVEFVGSKLIKVWQRHCEFKIAYYGAVTLFHQGLQSEEQQKMGERISFYQGAVDKLDEASKLSKNMEKAKVIGETLTFANDVIRGKLTAAQKENEFVYHEKVPPLSSLPEAKGASLVKGIPFSFTDKEVAGNDIFGRLVPLEAHQASSLYSEEKAKLLRRITSEIQEKDEELEMYLASMQLDSLAFEENLDALPQELVDCCADLNSRDALIFLTDTMAKISNVYHDLQSKIKETEELIKQEDAKEKEFCLVIGTKRAPNQILTEQKRELAKYKEAHEAALTSNQALHTAITQHKENISILSKPLNALVESLPSVAGVESDADKATRMEVQRLLNKVREMRTQRSEFEGQLRVNLQEDDVTKQLVTNQEDMEQFFKEQLSKHKNLVTLLEQNMSAQINILRALSEANAAYGATRRMINQVKGQRSEIVSSLLSSYNAFQNIAQKADEAKEFYSKLEAQVNKLSSRVKSFCKVQEEEREERLTANIKKFSGNAALGRQTDNISYNEPSATGPKLKDFLQAGLGGKGMQADYPSVDMSVGQGDYVYRIGAGGGGALAPSQIVPSYRTTPARPAPVGSEKTDVRTSCSQSMHPSFPHHFPPSAPSPAASSYPNTSSYFPPAMSYYQPHQTPLQHNVSSSVPIAPSSATTNNYPNFGYQSSNSSLAGANSSNTPSAFTTTVSSNSNFNFSTQSTSTVPSSGSYQTPYSQQHGFTSRNPPLNSSNINFPQSNQYTAIAPTRPQIPAQSTIPATPQATYKGTSFTPNDQNQQPVSRLGYSASSSAAHSLPPSNSSGSYVSQAGVYSTSISSSVHGSGLHTDHTGKNLPPSSEGQSQSALADAYNQSRRQSERGSVSYHENQTQSTRSSNTYVQGQSQVSAYSQNLPYGASVALPYKDGLPQSATASSFNQGYPQSTLAPTSGNQYQIPVSTTSLPYSSSQSTTSSAYNYSQLSGYGTVPSTIQSNVSSQFQAQHYSQAYPAVPQNSQSLQPGPTQVVQPPKVTPNVTTPATKSSQGGISNLDLLSGIDMSVSSSSQWSPLTPQTVISSDSTKNSVSVISITTTTAAPAPTAPDVAAATTTTTAIMSEEDKSKENGTTFPTTDTTSTDIITENVALSDSTAAVIDLTKLTKPKRTVTALDPLSDDETLNLLASETERFSKFVQGLDKKSLNGPTNLELKWNEFSDSLDTKCSKLKVSVGRCYPLKNRFPDNLSFDATRVPLPSARDDYINASYVQVKSVEDSIPLIITQAPMPNTFSDFWTMIWENQVELVVCLNIDAEIKGQVYVPKETADSFVCGNFTLTLKQVRPAPNDAWIQCTLQLTHNILKSSKVVLHIQFLTWPPSAMPESPSLFLQFITEVHNLQKQQRNKLKPVVVHCVSGTGRSGVFAILSSFMKHLHCNGNLADIWNLVIELSQQRRAAIQDRTHLLFLYSAALYYVQEVLMKRGILTDKATFEEGPREKTHVRHPSADLLSSDLNRMKAKLGLDETPSSDANLSRSGSQSSILSMGSSSGCASQPTPPPPPSVSPSPTHSAKGTKFGATELPPNLAASLDPNCLVLTTPNPAKAKKITKESFLSPAAVGGLGQADHQNANLSDPLSGLDPLWNLKKA